MRLSTTAITIALISLSIHLKADKLDTLGSPITIEIDTTLCTGEEYEGFTEAGIYIDTLTTSVCDTITIVNLNYYEPTPDTFSSACQNTFPDSAPGQYTNISVDTNGCDALEILQIIPATPNVTIDAEICLGDTVLWNNLFITALGSFQTEIIDANGCSYTETLRVTEKPAEDCLVSTESIDIYNAIRLYPNPASDYLKVEGLGSSAKGYSVELINDMGQAVFSSVSNESNLQIDISALPSGIYVAKINLVTSNKFKTILFLKE